MTLYSDGQRYWLVPEGLALPSGDLWMTDVAGNELRLDPAAAEPYEVDERTADGFVAREVDEVLPKVVGAAAGFLRGAARAPPGEVAAVIQGLMSTLRAVAVGDVEGIARFRLRCRRAAEDLEARGETALAAAVRALPDRLAERVAPE